MGVHERPGRYSLPGLYPLLNDPPGSRLEEEISNQTSERRDMGIRVPNGSMTTIVIDASNLWLRSVASRWSSKCVGRLADME